MLGTITNKTANKVPFEMLCEKLGNYISRKVFNTSDVVRVVRDIKYPIKYLWNNQEPK